jgi:hypothetical protein
VKRWVLSTISVTIAVITTAGCGGGEDSATALTKAGFTKQASAYCAEGEREVKAALAEYDEIVESTPGGKSDAGFQRDAAKEVLYRSILPSLQEELEHLEAAGAPAGDEANISQMVKTLSLAIEHFEDVGPGLPAPEQYVRFQDEAKANGLDCSPGAEGVG